MVNQSMHPINAELLYQDTVVAQFVVDPGAEHNVAAEIPYDPDMFIAVISVSHRG